VVFKEVFVRATRNRPNRSKLAVAAVAVIAIGILAAALPEFASGLAPEKVAQANLISIQQAQPAACLPDGTPVPDATSQLTQGNFLPAIYGDGSTPTLMARLEALPEYLMAMLQQGRRGGQREGEEGGEENVYRRRPDPKALTEIAKPLPFRTIRETFPVYTAVGVYLNTDEVFLQDNNLWSTRVFNRLDNTPAKASFTEPKRVIQGDKTFIQFNNGLYVDQANGDVYSVESDTGDKMVVFEHDAAGNVSPKRLLHTPHRIYSIAVDEMRKELYATVEYPPEVVVYKKEAQGNEKPIRRIVGDKALLEGPHGIAVDVKNGLLFVNNWGYGGGFNEPGTGHFTAPSINIYSIDAKGDTAPIRRIQGDKTELNWPGNMTYNPDTEELFIANDANQSIVVFNGLKTANGNVAPVRVLKGNRTKLNYPTGVFVDNKHQELWVSNLGNASANVYPLNANGNVAPLRTIRSAPLGHTSLTFGRTAAVAYDPNRQEILVPN
jgi:6-phosphogluconolactonase (cycloisomerase 2 family)